MNFPYGISYVKKKGPWGPPFEKFQNFFGPVLFYIKIVLVSAIKKANATIGLKLGFHIDNGVVIIKKK